MLRLNPNPFFRTLSVCGPPSGEMEVIHSTETHHPNPISSLPQQEIITSIKAVRTGGGERPSLWTSAAGPGSID